MSQGLLESHCARCLCLNPAGEDDFPNDWNVLTVDGECVGLICEDCITPGEQQAMDEDDAAMTAQLEPRCESCGRYMRRGTPFTRCNACS